MTRFIAATAFAGRLYVRGVPDGGPWDASRLDLQDEAALDEVRFLTNKSAGRLGALIAEAALEAGADVTFVFGRRVAHGLNRSLAKTG